MLNQITIMGRLTRDPEMRQTQSQIPVASFSLAVERDYKAEGSDSREVDFINCVAWRHNAEFVQKYFAKGSMAIVTGRLQMRNWEDKGGNKRATAEVIVDNIYFGESKRERAENQANSARANGTGHSNPPSGNGAGNRDRGAANVFVSGVGFHQQNSGNTFSELNEPDGELPF